MAVSVRVEDEAFSDIRYEVLGGYLGTSKYDALGRLCWLWRQCTQQSTYVLDQQVVQVIVDPVKLCDANLGVVVEQGIRIKGTEGRIEWLEERRNAKIAAGKARAETAKRNPDGTFASNGRWRPAGTSTASRAPAASSAPAPAPAPAPAQEDPPIVPRLDKDLLGFLKLFKKHFARARLCKTSTYKDEYKKARAKFSALEIRAASWAASRMDDEVRDNCTPKTILRLKGKKTTLPQWLEKANELWARDKPGEVPPWEQSQDENQ
jgi:hypothetical protein